MLKGITRLYVPGFIKKNKLKELFRLTADAFQAEMPDLQGLSFDRCVAKYAAFTKEQAESCLHEGSMITEVKSRLYRNAYILGSRYRKRYRIKTKDEAIAVLKMVYRQIGIDFRYDGHEFEIKQCFFSNYYSTEVCKLISSMDEGLEAGLTDGGSTLCFTGRIPEGCGCCKGWIQ